MKYKGIELEGLDKKVKLSHSRVMETDEGTDWIDKLLTCDKAALTPTQFHEVSALSSVINMDYQICNGGIEQYVFNGYHEYIAPYSDDDVAQLDLNQQFIMLCRLVAFGGDVFPGMDKNEAVTVKADDSNLTVTVPTVIPFTMGADGRLTSASSGALQIVNGSNFGIHVSGVSVAKQSPFNIVADASKASEDNAVDFQFGVDSALIDAAAPKAKAGSYDLAPTGAAGATLNLKAQGDAKNVKEDIAKDKTVATITWTFAAGNAAGGISVDDSWEGNHEMGID